jgi:uncharacterized integral membrane protein (TIGR00698 family)
MTDSAPPVSRRSGWWSALGLVAAGTVVATVVGELDAAPSPIAVALLLGLALSPLVEVGESSRVPLLGRVALRTGVVLLGFRITLGDISDLGAVTLLLAVVVSVAVLLVTLWAARRLGIARRLATLLGVGSAICGASAVAAAGTTIDASEEETAYAIATVTLIGTVATFALPAVGSRIGLDDRDIGVWIGMMVHDVGQVVAASTTVGDTALTAAIPVKLVRVLLLVPVLVILGSAVARRNRAAGRSEGAGRRLRGLVPGFVALFLLASTLSSLGVVPERIAEAAVDVERILFTAALFAIGVSVHLPTLRRIGVRPAMTSAVVWCTACAVTAVVLRR